MLVCLLFPPFSLPFLGTLTEPCCGLYDRQTRRTPAPRCFRVISSSAQHWWVSAPQQLARATCPPNKTGGYLLAKVSSSSSASLVPEVIRVAIEPATKARMVDYSSRLRLLVRETQDIVSECIYRINVCDVWYPNLSTDVRVKLWLVLYRERAGGNFVRQHLVGEGARCNGFYASANSRYTLCLALHYTTLW